jgi:glutathione-regulated potassium-efflux system ancillary protein KefG
MSKKILIVLGHPDYSHSNANKALIQLLDEAANVTVHNISEAYPDGKIDVQKEQALLESYDRIIFQFPTYWFNVPGSFKVWIDQVLTYGWAYGPGATALAGKEYGVATTTGSPLEVYQPDAVGFTIDAVILPVVASLKYCGSTYLGHAVLHNAMAVTPESVAEAKDSYLKLFA